ncbi:hypothetical protein Slin15195_G045210 [Septoria linicola]|uniref:Uncharacterized protein n=1 Tax=Septoria linicola TaxID=215465 RepID=A0A9Q9AKR9_9PEZI|nr:hypothetical protein Slin14017_G048730 [Septoria linicola]USW51202.1 hypothetical protein Slin15195_G045210 [Septoria linicola]
MARKTSYDSYDGHKRWNCCGARSRTPLCLLGMCVAPRMRDPPEAGMGTKMAVGATAVGVVGAGAMVMGSQYRQKRAQRRKNYYWRG